MKPVEMLCGERDANDEEENQENGQKNVGGFVVQLSRWNEWITVQYGMSFGIPIYNIH